MLLHTRQVGELLRGNSQKGIAVRKGLALLRLPQPVWRRAAVGLGDDGSQKAKWYIALNFF